MFPITSEFGYQFETQYLSAGYFQALVEYILIILIYSILNMIGQKELILLQVFKTFIKVMLF